MYKNYTRICYKNKHKHLHGLVVLGSFETLGLLHLQWPWKSYSDNIFIIAKFINYSRKPWSTEGRQAYISVVLNHFYDVAYLQWTSVLSCGGHWPGIWPLGPSKDQETRPAVLDLDIHRLMSRNRKALKYFLTVFPSASSNKFKQQLGQPLVFSKSTPHLVHQTLPSVGY